MYRGHPSTGQEDQRYGHQSGRDQRTLNFEVKICFTLRFGVVLCWTRINYKCLNQMTGGTHLTEDHISRDSLDSSSTTPQHTRMENKTDDYL